MENEDLLRGGDFVEVETTLITVDPTLQPIDPTQSLEAMQMMDQLMPMIGSAIIAINIILIITFFLKAWGLYLINKKLGEEHAWLAFIPVVQIWTYFTAAQKSFVTYFVYPIIALIAGAALASFTFGITAIAAYIYMIYCWITVLQAISLRTGRGGWSTAGMFFVPFIMLPVIGVKLEEGAATQTTEAPTEKDTKEQGTAEL